MKKKTLGHAMNNSIISVDDNDTSIQNAEGEVPILSRNIFYSSDGVYAYQVSIIDCW
jgi:hypothetical protein